MQEMTMHEMTLCWFLKKSALHRLSEEAASFWMDIYSYMQQNDWIDLISLAALKKGIHYDTDLFWRACLELQKAEMLEIVIQSGILYCRLPSAVRRTTNCQQAM